MTSSFSAATRSEGMPVLRRREHPPSALEIPFYDEELDVSQGFPHGLTTGPVHSKLKRCAKRCDLLLMVDNPHWGLDPKTGKEKQYYPDFAMLDLHPSQASKALLTDIQLAVEIVSTDHLKKEENDTDFKKILYQRHQVPEFLLLFPDLEDPRILTWYSLTASGYQEIKADASGAYRSRAIEGLRIKPLPKEKWQRDQKVSIFFGNLELKEAEAEYQARLKAENYNKQLSAEKDWERAAKERERAEKEEALILVDQERAEKKEALILADQERAEKERLPLLLKKAGIANKP